MRRPVRALVALALVSLTTRCRMASIQGQVPGTPFVELLMVDGQRTLGSQSGAAELCDIVSRVLVDTLVQMGRQ